MGVLRTTSISNIKAELNEPSDTPAGGNDEITTDAFISLQLDRGFAWACRTFYPMQGVGTKATYPAARRTITFQDLLTKTDQESSVSSAVMIAATEALYGATRLTYCDEQYLRLHQDTNLPGTPTHWYPVGTSGVGLWPVPNASVLTLTVRGYVAPPDRSSGGGTFNWVPDDLAVIAELYAQIHVALKNFDDSSLAGRALPWSNKLQQIAETLYAGIPDTLKKMAYKVPPVPFIVAQG